MATPKDTETPLMKQYNAIKTKYPDALLLFRVGDFYETFGADAIKIANISGIVLTKLDGTAKGGIVLAIKDSVGIPVKFVGLGEKETDLRVFDIENYIYGLFKEWSEE